MRYDDEKDYIMRIIKETAGMLFSVLLGKPYVSVEMQKENPYVVYGKNLEEYKSMADQGKINEAENMLVEGIDYTNRREAAAAVLFYQYVSEKGEDFLKQNNYSMEEVLEGLKRLAEQAGLEEVCSMLED